MDDGGPTTAACGADDAVARPPGFDAETCEQRDTVGRRVNRAERGRGPARRTDELAIAFRVVLHLAAIPIRTRG